MFAILGATGKLGQATARALRASGHPVRAIVRDRARGEALAAQGCELAVASLGDRDALAAAFAGASAVQLICPVLARAADAYAEMVAMIETAAAALEAARAPAVLAISDYGAELPGRTGVTRVFHALEQRLRRLDAALTFVRSAEHMQNWARQVPAAAASGRLASMHHPLTKRFPTVSAMDVGEVSARLLLERRAAGVSVVHVEGPRRYTPLEVAAALTRLCGREIAAVELPRADWQAALERGGIGRSYAELVVELYDAHNAGQIDVEPGGQVVRGTTEIADVLASLLPAARRE